MVGLSNGIKSSSLAFSGSLVEEEEEEEEDSTGGCCVAECRGSTVNSKCGDSRVNSW